MLQGRPTSRAIAHDGKDLRARRRRRCLCICHDDSLETRQELWAQASNVRPRSANKKTVISRAGFSESNTSTVRPNNGHDGFFGRKICHKAKPKGRIVLTCIGCHGTKLLKAYEADSLSMAWACIDPTVNLFES